MSRGEIKLKARRILNCVTRRTEVGYRTIHYSVPTELWRSAYRYRILEYRYQAVSYSATISCHVLCVLGIGIDTRVIDAEYAETAASRRIKRFRNEQRQRDVRDRVIRARLKRDGRPSTKAA